jgi:beta-1,4-N-acetylglucosaminyltransferase
MIFLTVGTSHFDTLVREMDELAESGRIIETIIAQIGTGMYIPKNFPHVRLLRNLDHAYQIADVIVSAGGAGTTIECTTRGLKLVVVENELVMEGHQRQLIEELNRRGHLVWCRSLNELPDCIELAKKTDFKPFKTDAPRAHKIILSLLREGGC